MNPSALELKTKLRFKNRRLLEQALAHPSYLNELQDDPGPGESYERLEFLGDSVLGLVITLELYKRHSDLTEGDLTKLRASLVRSSTLAGVARRLELGQNLNLGKGEESTGGRDRDSNLADAFEALTGAIFLDKGFDTATRFVLGTMREEIESIMKDGVPEDPKSRLQELIQRTGGTAPSYRVVKSGGPDHHKSFSVEVVMDGRVIGTGHGKRKLDAEKQAASEALDSLESSAEV